MYTSSLLKLRNQSPCKSQISLDRSRESAGSGSPNTSILGELKKYKSATKLHGGMAFTKENSQLISPATIKNAGLNDKVKTAVIQKLVRKYGTVNSPMIDSEVTKFLKRQKISASGIKLIESLIEGKIGMQTSKLKEFRTGERNVRFPQISNSNTIEDTLKESLKTLNHNASSQIEQIKDGPQVTKRRSGQYSSVHEALMPQSSKALRAPPLQLKSPSFSTQQDFHYHRHHGSQTLTPIDDEWADLSKLKARVYKEEQKLQKIQQNSQKQELRVSLELQKAQRLANLEMVKIKDAELDKYAIRQLEIREANDKAKSKEDKLRLIRQRKAIEQDMIQKQAMKRNERKKSKQDEQQQMTDLKQKLKLECDENKQKRFQDLTQMRGFCTENDMQKKIHQEIKHLIKVNDNQLSVQQIARMKKDEEQRGLIVKKFQQEQDLKVKLAEETFKNHQKNKKDQLNDQLWEKYGHREIEAEKKRIQEEKDTKQRQKLALKVSLEQQLVDHRQKKMQERKDQEKKNKDIRKTLNEEMLGIRKEDQVKALDKKKTAEVIRQQIFEKEQIRKKGMSQVEKEYNQQLISRLELTQQKLQKGIVMEQTKAKRPVINAQTVNYGGQESQRNGLIGGKGSQFQL